MLSKFQVGTNGNSKDQALFQFSNYCTTSGSCVYIAYWFADHDCDVCGESGIAHWRCKECNESKFMCIDCETLKHKNKKMAHNPQTLVDYYTENPVKSGM